MRGAGGDGDEKTVFACAVWAGGDRDGGGLRRAGGAGHYGDVYVFIDDSWACAGAALAHAIEIRVVKLSWKIIAGPPVTDGEIFAAEEGGGVRVRS